MDRNFLEKSNDFLYVFKSLTENIELDRTQDIPKNLRLILFPLLIIVHTGFDVAKRKKRTASLQETLDKFLSVSSVLLIQLKQRDSELCIKKSWYKLWLLYLIHTSIENYLYFDFVSIANSFKENLIKFNLEQHPILKDFLYNEYYENFEFKSLGVLSFLQECEEEGNFFKIFQQFPIKKFEKLLLEFLEIDEVIEVPVLTMMAEIAKEENDLSASGLFCSALDVKII
ncbi:hypothetical protein HDU92_001470 [Lobulomyces angularis]|nr:hypothetical protein HDU92_001470 [Lobulomyces angularis]